MSETFKFKNILKDLIIENDNESGRKPPISPSLLIKYLYDIKKYDFNEFDVDDFSDIYGDVLDKIKYIGINATSEDLEGYVYEFIKSNIGLLKDGEKDESRFELPKYQKFEVEGNETYTARMSDFYTDTHYGYSEEEIRTMYNDGELYIYDGNQTNSETYDTWDNEVEIDSITGTVVEDYKRLSGLV